MMPAVGHLMERGGRPYSVGPTSPSTQGAEDWGTSDEHAVPLTNAG
jgi:hypothetical protein